MTTTTTTTDHDEATVELTRPAGPPPQTPAGYAPGFYGQPGYGQPAPGYGAYPPPQWGAGFPPPPPRRGLGAVSRGAWIAVAAAVGLVVAMVAAVVVGAGIWGGGSPQAVPATADAEAAPELATAADLPAMLLRPEVIAQVVGQPGSEAMAVAKPVRFTPSGSGGTSDPACAAVALPAREVAYQGSGYTAIQSQMTVARPSRNEPQLWTYQQAVAVFPTTAAAEKFAAASAPRWNSCAGRSWSETYSDGSKAFWSASEIGTAEGLLMALTTQENGGGWGCWRGLKAHANAVMDFVVCGENLPATVLPAAAAAIARKGQPI